MRVIFTENRDKAARVVNGQQATIVSSQNNTIILRLPEGQLASDTLPIYTSLCADDHKGSRAKHWLSHHLAGLSLGSTRYCLSRPLQS